MKFKFGFAEKVVVSLMVAYILALSYAIIFETQWLLNVSFVILLSATAFYGAWNIVLYTKSLSNNDEKAALFLLIKVIVIVVIFLVVLFMSIMCFTSNWFVLTPAD